MSEKLQIMKDLATREAKNLRIHATPKEIRKLNFDTFMPCGERSCIYGQMTGDCNSDRASELIFKCAEKVYHFVQGSTKTEDYELNGAPYIVAGKRSPRYFSPIESLIVVGLENMFSSSKGIYGLQVIKFLKGETDTLEL